MTRVVVVTSGKGGVGKTTTSASFASGLAMRGKKTAVIDFDIGLRNLDLILGCERRVVYDFINVIQGDAKLSQALVRDKRSENLSILAASQTKDKDGSQGYNAQEDKWEDLIAAGVIDPTKVTRSALQNAASIASMVLTTDTLVVEKKVEQEPAAAAGHGHGHGH